MKRKALMGWMFALFCSSTAMALDIDYEFNRDLSKPATTEALEVFSKSLEKSPFTEIEVVAGGDFALDVMDQVWLNQSITQAVMIKLDIKPKEEKMMNQFIKLDEGYLVHGVTESNHHFVAFFYGMSQRESEKYFHSFTSTKVDHQLNAALQFLEPTQAHAGPVLQACKSNIKTGFAEIRSNVKELFTKNKWSCFKNFIRSRYGNFLNAIIAKIADYQSGQIWKKLGKSVRLMGAALSAFLDGDVLKKMGDIVFLPAKKQSEILCSCLGGTGLATKDVIEGNAWGSSERKYVKDTFKNNLDRHFSAPDVQSDIAKAKSRSIASENCSKVSSKTKSVVEATREGAKEFKKRTQKGK
jgi:hypothetical protein